MIPQCEACHRGQHGECGQRGQNSDIVCGCNCPTATDARAMRRSGEHIDMQTDTPVPNYAALDLWMALGLEPNHEFEDAIAVRGMADVWAHLLEMVRKTRTGLKNIEREEAKRAGQAENGDPLHLRAKAAVENIAQVTGVTTDVVPGEDLHDGRGRVMRRGNLEVTVTVTGLLG